jgi:DNA-binding NarL/FixJ family response regulator
MPTTTSSQKRTVFLVDDHPLVREWLSNLINQQSDLAVCGEAADKAHAITLIASTKPEIAVVDISLEEGSGIELIKDIKVTAPEVAILVLSMHDESLYAERSLRAGARGYVMKREVTRNVLQAIRCVLDGKLYLSEKIATALAEKWVEGRPTVLSPVERLSDRELEVFQSLGCGYSTRQTAERLNVSIKTVQAFCARIKEKLNLANANELLREAVRWHDRENAD